MAERGSLTAGRTGWMNVQISVAAILLLVIAALAIREIGAGGVELGGSNESQASAAIGSGYDRERVLAAESARLTGLAEAHLGVGSAVVDSADRKFYIFGYPRSGASAVDPADAKFFNPQSHALDSAVDPADVKFFNMGAPALDAAIDRADVKFYNLNDAYGSP